MVNQNIMTTTEYILTHRSLNLYTKHFKSYKLAKTEFLSYALLSITVDRKVK
jgi:hypothetical protein